MIISTTLLIGLLLLIPSLIMFIFPYKATTYFSDGDEPTARFFGTFFASILLMFFIFVTSIRLSCDHCGAQMTDLSSLVKFKSQSTANVSDTYSKISSED